MRLWFGKSSLDWGRQRWRWKLHESWRGSKTSSQLPHACQSQSHCSRLNQMVQGTITHHPREEIQQCYRYLVSWLHHGRTY